MLCWGCAFPFMDYLLHPQKGAEALLRPMPLILLRHLLASLAILPYLLYCIHRRGRPGAAHLARHALLGTLGIMGYQVPLLYGMYMGAPPNVAPLIVISSPVIVALLSSMVLAERVYSSQWAGIALATAGVAFVILLGPRALDAAHYKPWAVALIALSPICFGTYTVLVRRITRKNPGAPARTGRTITAGLELAAWHTILVTIVIAPVTFLVAPDTLRTFADLPVAGWGAIAYLGVVPTAAGMFIWCWALERLPAASVAVWVCPVPLVAAAASYLVRGTALSPTIILGAALILGGMFFVQKKSPVA